MRKFMEVCKKCKGNCDAGELVGGICPECLEKMEKQRRRRSAVKAVKLAKAPFFSDGNARGIGG